jgi:protein O-mannosyl-transferase
MMREGWRRGWLFAALLGAVLLAYQPAWRGTPVWDDDAHITRLELRSADGLKRIWLEPGATQQYYPVLHSAFWVEHRIWGDAPLGYHLANIVFHSIAAVLVFACLRRLAVPGAVLSAFVFALHPVHVESVAWVSEQKNTLSAVFGLAAALFYLRFEESRRARDYALAAVLFALALATKSVTATLPIALAAALWWRDGRLERRHVASLLPLVAVGAAAGLLTAWVERTFIGAAGAEFHVTPIERGLVAARAIVFYAGKLAWPTGLTFNYPRWQLDQGAWWQYLYPAGLVLLAIALWLRARAPLAAFVAFCALLFPALGFVDVYPFRYSFVADHFEYLASIPLIALACGVAAVAGGGKPRPYDGESGARPDAVAAGLAPARIVGAALAAALVVSLGVMTWFQSRNYTDAETLYRSILQTNPASWFAHNNLGFLLLERGDSAEAAVHLEEALRLNPSVWEHHANVGLLRLRYGPIEAAAPHFENALRLNPSYAEAHNNLGHLRFREGKLAEAKAHFEAAIRLKPGLAEAHSNLASVLLGEGVADRALAEYREAARLKPDLVEAVAGECRLSATLAPPEAAAAACTQALGRQPESADLHYGLGVALYRQGRLDESIAQFAETVRLRPGDGQAHNDLGVALAAKGRAADALAEMQAAVRLQGDNPDALFNLANLLQRLGRPADAVPLYRRALATKPDDATIRNNLGGALQATGRLREAEAEFAAALRLKPDFPAARENLARVRAIGRRQKE